MNPVKTNACRILEREGVAYTAHSYPCDGFRDALSVAAEIGVEPERVFKTLVTVSGNGEHLVFVIPAGEELDLKAAARVAGVKSVEMLPLARLTPVTGYQRGACSPMGMKKRFPTFLDETAVLFDAICVSGGKWGLQLELAPEELLRVTQGNYGDLTIKET